MSTSENYLGRLVSAVSGSSSASGAGITSLLRSVTGTSSSRVSGSAGATAVRLGSSLLGNSVMSSVSKASPAGIASTFGSGGSPLGLLASFLGGLFGSDDDAVVAKPQKYQAATPVHYNFGLSGNGQAAYPVDNGVGGLSRPAASNLNGRDVVIQVQAMDSRSFLDHSNEIAEAVRKALLDSHPLRDVMTE